MDPQDILEFTKAISSASFRNARRVVFKEFEISLVKSTDSSGPLGELKKATTINGPVLVACKFNDTLSTLSKADHSKDEILNSTEISSETCKVNENGESGFSTLEGSPLKLLTIADLSAIGCPVVQVKSDSAAAKRKRYDAVSLKRARYLLSLYTAVHRKVNCETSDRLNKDIFRPLWVLCDGENPGNIVGLSVNETKLPDNNFVVHRSSVVKLSGPKPMKVYTSEVINQQSKIGPAKQWSCQAEFDVVGSLLSENPMAGLQGSVKLKVKWASSQHLLQTPPLDAETTAKVQVSAGDTKSAGYYLYRELDLLRRLVGSLTSGEIKWAADNRDKKILLQDEIKAVLGKLILSETKSTVTPDDSVSEDALKQRVDLDFTDHLWIVLQGCSSFSDLIDSFQLVFNQLKSGELQPMVFRNNKTSLAQIVRDSFTGRVYLPSLSTGTLAIELLAEIGVEKLTRDYVSIFLSKDLTTPKHLEYFTTQDLSLDEKVKRLEKMHCVLELIMILQRFLNTPHSTLSTCARHTLQYFETNQLDWENIFQVPVPTTSIAKLLESAEPYMWQCQEVVDEGRMQESITRRLCTEMPLQHLDSASGDCYSILDNTQADKTVSVQYYLLSVTDRAILV